MLLKTSAGGLIFNPGEPAVRQFLIDTVAEIVENYDVDAIHFDDYFYAQLANDSADNITMQKYPIAGINNKADWRREQVTTFIRDLSNYLKDFNARNNRVIQLGISPTGIGPINQVILMDLIRQDSNTTDTIYMQIQENGLRKTI